MVICYRDCSAWAASPFFRRSTVLLPFLLELFQAMFLNKLQVGQFSTSHFPCKEGWDVKKIPCPFSRLRRLAADYAYFRGFADQ